MARTINLPISPEAIQTEWRCAGCGCLSINRKRSCSCPTSIVRRGNESAWKLTEGDDGSARVAEWMIDRGYPTGHGDTIEDLLNELANHMAIRQAELLAAAKRIAASMIEHGTEDNDPKAWDALQDAIAAAEGGAQ